MAASQSRASSDNSGAGLPRSRTSGLQVDAARTTATKLGGVAGGLGLVEFTGNLQQLIRDRRNEAGPSLPINATTAAEIRAEVPVPCRNQGLSHQFCVIGGKHFCVSFLFLAP
jgi:hypothetical protein